MKILFLLLLSLTILENGLAQNKKNMQHCEKKSALLRHFVVFKYKDASTTVETQKVSDAFMDLKNKIPQIVDIEYGINNSPENLNQGFTHCYLLSFKSEADAAIYQQHEAHKAFQEILKPHLDKVFVVDYWRK